MVLFYQCAPLLSFFYDQMCKQMYTLTHFFSMYLNMCIRLLETYPLLCSVIVTLSGTTKVPWRRALTSTPSDPLPDSFQHGKRQ